MNAQNASQLLVPLNDPNAAQVSQCGGKSAGLHLLLRAGLPVPPGFVITTRAFDSMVRSDMEFQRTVALLQTASEGQALREAARIVRETIMVGTFSEAFAHHVISAWESITQTSPVAVRSSATAEDLTNASFAGQQDTYLNIETQRELMESIRACWASLFTERAVIYRRTRGFDDSRVSMAVVVQRMVNARAAGVLFTADPISNRRDVFVVEAIPGLGEAFVSGHAAPERYRIRARDGHILERIGKDGKPLAEKNGLLSSSILGQLHALGQSAHKSAALPVDIEWALEKDHIYLLQSRPITTLWPLPEGKPLPGWRVFLSFGHLQVYTSPLSRVGASMFARLSPLRRDPQTGLSTLVRNSGERIFLDVTPAISRSPFNKLFARFLKTASEPVAARVQTAMRRPDLHALPNSERANLMVVIPIIARFLRRAVHNMLRNPSDVRETYLDELQKIVHHQQERIQRADSIQDRFDAMYDELGTFLGSIMTSMFPRMLPAIVMSQFVPSWISWIAPDVDHRIFLQGLEGNITTEMDLALADLADLARDVPSLTAALTSENPVLELERIRHNDMCAAFFQAWDAFLHTYGHRSAGEIDPGVPRWREDPRIPLRSIAGALARPRGALRAQHLALSQRATECRDLLKKEISDKPLGSVLAPLTDGLINRMRILLSAREHHKFYMVQVINNLRTVTLEAGTYLVENGALENADDIWFLELPEIQNALRNVKSRPDPQLASLVATRRTLRDRYAHMTPPAVMTNVGEAIPYQDTRDLPENSLAGTPVSGGLYEGTARVVHDPATEDLGAGEILVARFTDPGWTPLFGHAGALIMEVGGQMTHGSVIAREIGIPAVVAVEGATQKIRSGDRIRVDGEQGFVTILEGAHA